MIHPSSIIHDGAEIGTGVEIGPFCEIGSDVTLEDGVRVHSHVRIGGRTRLGEACEAHSGVVLGEPPQILGLAPSPEARLEIGPRCTLREYVTAHVGSPDHGGVTRIGADCFLMVGVHVGHDCRIGEKCVIANNVAIAGHVHLGEQVWIGGQAAIHQFTEIADHAFIAGGAILVGDVPPFTMAAGNHARLSGLNVNGLKRRGFSREDMKTLRAAYRMVFAGEGTFDERAEAVATQFADSALAMQLVDFVRADRKRPLCLPDRT